jgi:GNAT superfamily N-acetyltransferase
MARRRNGVTVSPGEVVFSFANTRIMAIGMLNRIAGKVQSRPSDLPLHVSPQRYSTSDPVGVLIRLGEQPGFHMSGHVSHPSSELLLRNMTAADIPAGLRLCRESGWNQLESDWRVFLNWNPSACRVAERNGQLVGTIAALRYGDCFTWLSMVVVAPNERGAGIGTRLLQEQLALLRDDCVRLDATPLGRPLYARYGFVDEYPLSRMTAAVHAADFTAVPSVHPMREEDLAQVLPFDLAVFGADRSPLLRALFQLAPGYAWIAENAGSIEGYSFGRPGFLYDQLGPVIAQDAQTARDLVSASLSSRNGTTVAIDVPASNAAWLSWLGERKFSPARSFVRMRQRENKHPGVLSQIYAITGPEFG